MRIGWLFCILIACFVSCGPAFADSEDITCTIVGNGANAHLVIAENVDIGSNNCTVTNMANPVVPQANTTWQVFENDGTTVSDCVVFFVVIPFHEGTFSVYSDPSALATCSSHPDFTVNEAPQGQNTAVTLLGNGGRDITFFSDTPEPPSWLLLASGLVGFMGLSGRRLLGG